jgi:Zn-dependent protease/predicted transcriptional regulator
METDRPEGASMRESIRLGRIAGISVGLNFSVFVILAILIFGLAAGRFPAVFPGRSAASYVAAAVIAALLFFFSLLAHELAHAIVARRNGVEVDGITLWLFGGVARLRSEPRSPGADFRIAVVGPLTSVALAVLFGIVAVGLQAGGVTGLPVGIFGYLAGVNALLAVFNLIPAAPLDGGRVLRAALWHWRRDRLSAAIAAATAGRVFGYVLVALGILQVATGRGFDGIWLVLIGLFLVNAATAEEQQSRLADTLHGIRVRDVMTANPVTANPQDTLDRFIAETALSHRFSAYPLTDADGRLIGMTTLNRIRNVPPDRRAHTRLGDIACPLEQLPTATPDEQLVGLMQRMTDCADGRAIVLDEAGRVVGIVSPTDISRAILLRDLTPFDPYQGPRGADVTAWTGHRS